MKRVFFFVLFLVEFLFKKVMQKLYKIILYLYYALTSRKVCDKLQDVSKYAKTFWSHFNVHTKYIYLEVFSRIILNIQ